MKNRIFIIAALLASMTAATAQTTVLLSGEKHTTDTRVRVNNYQVAQTDGKTVVSLDFILDSLAVPSNRYRAFTPVIISKDSTQVQRLKSFLVTGRTQEIIFDRDGIDELYADNFVKVRREKGMPQTYSYTDAVERQSWHQGADVYMECDLCGCGDQKKNELAYLGTLLPPIPTISSVWPTSYQLPPRRSATSTAQLISLTS